MAVRKVSHLQETQKSDPQDPKVHPLWDAAKDHLDKISLIQAALDDFAVIASEAQSGRVTANILSIMADSLNQAYYSLNDLLFRELQEKQAFDLWLSCETQTATANSVGWSQEKLSKFIQKRTSSFLNNADTPGERRCRMRHPRNATRFPVLRYSEFGRRLQLKAVYQRIQGLRRTIENSAQELRQLESVLTGRGGAA